MPAHREDWQARFLDPLPRSFYDRPTQTVARGLLGACLVSRARGRSWRVARIVETEAYVEGDPASHAYRGPTPRNRSMFARPGTLYVYRIHQVHCANAVTRTGTAVLLRAAEPLAGGLGPTSGPGRLAAAFGIGRAQDGADLLRGRLRIVRGEPPEEPIVAVPRVGLRLAKDRPLRFVLGENPWVSAPRPWRRRRGDQRSLAQSKPRQRAVLPKPHEAQTPF